MSDKRRTPEDATEPADSVEASVRAERRTRPEVPMAIIPATGINVQPVVLGDGSAGVGVELSNAVFKVPFPLDMEQTRTLINNLEASRIEALAMVDGPAGEQVRAR